MPYTEYDGIVINQVTLAQYKAMKAAGNIVTSQTYVITDLAEHLEELSNNITPNVLKMSNHSINIVNNLTLSISNTIITLNGTSNSATYYGWFKWITLAAGKYEFGAKIKGGTYSSNKEHYTFAINNNEVEEVIYPWAIDYEPVQFTLSTGNTIGFNFWVDDQTSFNNYQIELYIKKLEEYPEFYWQVRTGRAINNSDCVFFNQNYTDFTNVPLGNLVKLDANSGSTYYLKFIKEGNTYKLAKTNSSGQYSSSDVMAQGTLTSMVWIHQYVIFPYSLINYFAKATLLINDVNIMDNIMRINNYNF